MPDEPELKEDDPVQAIRGALRRALKTLKNLLGQEDKDLKEEMDEVEGVGAASGQQPSDQTDDKGQQKTAD